MTAGSDPRQPIVADGGLAPPAVSSAGDPWRALDELMVVVQALCPVWPDRPTFESSTRFLL